jgi:hypothetical protein
MPQHVTERVPHTQIFCDRVASPADGAAPVHPYCSAAAAAPRSRSTRKIGSVTEAVRLIRDGGVDLLRLHTSSVGALTPTRKLVALAELLGVRTAFHSPGDVSPVGVAANLAVDISTPAFGYQESHTYNDATHEVSAGNTRATFAVLEEAGRAGVPRVMIASSYSILGLSWSHRRLHPDYYPIDERLPLQVQDRTGCPNRSTRPARR